MRIIGGLFRHREIARPSSEITRPTSDRVKEALFSAINEEIKGKVVLDLFAGSGGLGIEALSRGGKFLYTNDKSLVASKVIIANMKLLKIDSYELTTLDYLKALDKYENNGLTFGLVFLDPPYEAKINAEIVNLLISKNLLVEDGVVVVESEFLTGEIPGFILKQYRYGYRNIEIYRRKI